MDTIRKIIEKRFGKVIYFPYLCIIIKSNNIMQFISKVAAVELINQSKGKIFTAEFRKKDNTTRVMNCRLGVTKGVTGSGMAYNPSLKGLKPVYDMQVKEWRMINLDTITRLTIKGENYLVH